MINTDGNKRTAAVAGELFLELDGRMLRAKDADLYALIVTVAAGEIGEDALAKWLCARYGRAALARRAANAAEGWQAGPASL